MMEKARIAARAYLRETHVEMSFSPYSRYDLSNVPWGINSSNCTATITKTVNTIPAATRAAWSLVIVASTLLAAFDFHPPVVDIVDSLLPFEPVLLSFPLRSIVAVDTMNIDESADTEPSFLECIHCRPWTPTDLDVDKADREAARKAEMRWSKWTVAMSGERYFSASSVASKESFTGSTGENSEVDTKCLRTADDTELRGWRCSYRGVVIHGLKGSILEMKIAQPVSMGFLGHIRRLRLLLKTLTHRASDTWASFSLTSSFLQLMIGEYLPESSS